MSRRLTTTELLNELQRLADELGKTPTQREMNERGEYAHCVYHRRFGSWKNAVGRAGLEPNTRGVGYVPADDLIDALQRLADDLGHTPTEREMNAHGKHAASTYRERFGTWYGALDAADLEPTTHTQRDWSAIRELTEAEP